MAKKRMGAGAALALGLLLLFIVLERVAFYTFAPERYLKIVLFDQFIIASVFVTALYSFIQSQTKGTTNILAHALTEEKSFRGFLLDIATGFGVGLLMSLGIPNSTYRSVLGEGFSSAPSLAKEALPPALSTFSNIVLTFLYYLFHVAPAEEFAVISASALLSVVLIRRYKYKEIKYGWKAFENPLTYRIIIAWVFGFIVIHGVVFRGFEFSPKIILSTGLAGLILSITYFARGVAANVAAHGLFDFNFNVFTKTLQPIFYTYTFYLFIVLALLYVASYLAERAVGGKRVKAVV